MVVAPGPGVKTRTPGYLRERRIAHSDVFGFYRERVAGSGLLAFKSAERAFELLTDQDALDNYLRSLDPSQREDVISALETYEHEFPIEAVVPATVVLFNLIRNIPDRPRGFLDFDARLVVTRVVLRLLQRLPGPDAIEAAVRSTLPQITTLRDKLALVNLVGHDPNLGHELISEQASLALEAELREEIRSTQPRVLAEEQELLWVVAWTKRTTGASEPNLELPLDAVLGGALLKGAVSEARRQGMGTRVVQTQKRFQLESLVELVGSEDKVRQIVELCRDQGDDPSLAETVGLERVMDFVEGVSPEWPSLRRNNGVFADASRRRVAGSGPGTLKRLISRALRASEPSHDSASPPEVHNRF